MSNENFEIEHWFCNGCKTELDPMSVTFNENCVYCGHAAEWIKSTSVIRENEQLQRENEELKKCFESLLGYYCEAIPYLPKELRDELKRNCEAIKKEEGE